MKLPHSLKPNRDWIPLIPPRFRIAIVAILPIEAIMRGLDYATGDHPDITNSLTFIERAMPLEAWGMLCIIGGLAALTGLLYRIRALCIFGFHILGATYATLAIGLIAKTIERGGDGFRTPFMFICVAVIFWGLALSYWTHGKRQ